MELGFPFSRKSFFRQLARLTFNFNFLFPSASLTMDPNASVPIPQHEFPSFGSGSFTDEEKAQIQRMLETTIGIEDVCFREGPASSTPFI